MFNSITGTITGKSPQTVFLETGSEEAGFLEWDIMIPDTSLNSLPPVGNKAKVYIWFYHHEDSMKLFGFSSSEERSIFVDLMKVDGIGPKAAVKILSNVNGKQLADVLNSEDLAKLEKIPGVGKKTAQKMLLTLKGKLTVSEETVTVISKKALSPWQDVIVALTNMGYDKKNVEELVSNLAVDIDASLGKKEAEDIIFRKAIVELAN